MIFRICADAVRLHARLHARVHDIQAVNNLEYLHLLILACLRDYWKCSDTYRAQGAGYCRSVTSAGKGARPDSSARSSSETVMAGLPNRLWKQQRRPHLAISVPESLEDDTKSLFSPGINTPGHTLQCLQAETPEVCREQIPAAKFGCLSLAAKKPCKHVDTRSTQMSEFPSMFTVLALEASEYEVTTSAIMA